MTQATATRDQGSGISDADFPRPLGATPGQPDAGVDLVEEARRMVSGIIGQVLCQLPPAGRVELVEQLAVDLESYTAASLIAAGRRWSGAEALDRIGAVLDLAARQLAGSPGEQDELLANIYVTVEARMAALASRSQG